jgi:hypothetical protein
MAYQDAQVRLAAQTERRVLAAFVALNAAGFVVVAAAVVAVANVLAFGLADLSLAALVRALPLGIAPPADDTERLERSFTTLARMIAADEVVKFHAGRPLGVQIPAERIEPVRERVGRVGYSEPTKAGRRAYREAMVAHRDEVVGWRRKAQPGACPLCRSLADGSVLPVEQLPADHPNCSCVAVPILKEAA